MSKHKKKKTHTSDKTAFDGPKHPKSKFKKLKVSHTLYSMVFAVGATLLMIASGYRGPFELLVFLVLAYLTALSYFVEVKK